MRLTSEGVQAFWKALNFSLFFLAAFLLGGMWAKSACAQDAPYWQRTHEPVHFNGVVFVPAPGGSPHFLGYFRRETGVMELRPDLSPTLQACVVKHEDCHRRGYSHRIGPHFAVDCCDGTIQPLPAGRI